MEWHSAEDPSEGIADAFLGHHEATHSNRCQAASSSRPARDPCLGPVHGLAGHHDPCLDLDHVEYLDLAVADSAEDHGPCLDPSLKVAPAVVAVAVLVRPEAVEPDVAAAVAVAFLELAGLELIMAWPFPFPG